MKFLHVIGDVKKGSCCAGVKISVAVGGFLAALLLLPLPAVARVQFPEEIVIEGNHHLMPFAPLEVYFAARGGRPDWLIASSSSCYRGYVGTWEIRGDALYLIRAVREEFTEGGMQRFRDITERLFPRLRTPLFASWFTGTLVLNEVPPWRRKTTKREDDGVVFLGFEKGKLTKVAVQDAAHARRTP